MSQGLQAMNVQKNLSLWAGRISEYRSSGQNVKVWCKENGICEQTYYRWQKRLFELAKAQQEVQFAEVTRLQPVRPGNMAVTVRIAGVEADVYSGADAAEKEEESSVTVIAAHKRHKKFPRRCSSWGWI